MNKWFPRLYDPVMAPLEKKKFMKIRKRLISKAEGRVLEVGLGTGVNLPFYLRISHLTAVEPNPNMLKRALPKMNAVHTSVNAHLGKAEELPYSENSFDTVVGTLVFCTIPDPEKALQQIRRVLKPGGKLLLFEHVRLDHRFLGKMQDLLTPIWKQLCDGCCLNRNTLKTVKEAGFHEEQVESAYGKLFLEMIFSNPK